MPNVMVCSSIASTYAFCPSVLGRMLLPRPVRIAWLSTSAGLALPALQDAGGARHIDGAEVGAVLDQQDELADETLGGRDRLRRSLERDLVAAHEHGHLGELVLDRGEQAILRAEEPDHGHAIHLEFGAARAAR